MSSSIDSSVKITKPFSSDTDKDKQDLLLDADLYKDKLELQWSGLKTDATEYGKKALIIGGVVAATYVVMNAVLPKSKKEKRAEREEAAETQAFKAGEEKQKSKFAVGAAVQSLAWTLAVGWARQKLKNIIADERKTE
ncbi:hypothetical protein [Dyadobacter psychrophilus]|uniref:Uncharacterized protein n=1 Tax=Dyadobacter psychrophilus TaxID=651661 RepID=A0A1T5GZF5_9BACT|nr:hypothetical protein [Dyadobacter psychrophilus]SKC13765.1 hypothetical protein SAMN05660293_04643 [Dyadobacter psychrophilus]